MTIGYGINQSGAVAGSYIEASVAPHGFIRDSKGALDLFDIPGSLSIYPYSINGVGDIAGFYSDATLTHGFIRTGNGVITTIDPPGAGTEFSQGTIVTAINSFGAIAGHYGDPAGQTHGFVRDSSGTITTFDPPGSSFTTATGINDVGQIVGSFYNPSMGRNQGYLLTP